MKGGKNLEDHNIVDLYWFRDENANNILYNLEDSKECVNDTYLKTWNSIPPTRPKILKAFLGKITRNLALNIYKSKNCQKRKGEVPLVLDELKECIPSQNDIDTEMEEKYLTKYINEFLKSLPREKRIIIVQRYWYLYSIKDIAEKNNLSQSNVKMTLSRFRTKLKEFLEERGQYI
jgi:RNA polymerase sigma factor (sigma-70 family)